MLCRLIISCILVISLVSALRKLDLSDAKPAEPITARGDWNLVFLQSVSFN